MGSFITKTEPNRKTPHAEQQPTFRSVRPTQVAPVLNTILVVREHAPAEIEELESEIRILHAKLGAAYSRKRLLEQLLSAIREADAAGPAPQSGMAVLR